MQMSDQPIVWQRSMLLGMQACRHGLKVIQGSHFDFEHVVVFCGQVFVLLKPNSDPTIQMSQQKSRPIKPGNTFPVSSYQISGYMQKIWQKILHFNIFFQYPLCILRPHSSNISNQSYWWHDYCMFCAGSRIKTWQDRKENRGICHNSKQIKLSLRC